MTFTTRTPKSTESANITGGSEKQNAYATSIANGWLKQLDAEINNTIARMNGDKSDALQWYLDNLEGYREKIMAGFGKMTAKQLLDVHAAKMNPATQALKNAFVRKA